MISPMDSLVDKVDYYKFYANIDILVTRALFVMEFFTYTVKITWITIIFELFSKLIPIWKNLPPNLSKGFIERHCNAIGTMAMCLQNIKWN